MAELEMMKMMREVVMMRKEQIKMKGETPRHKMWTEVISQNFLPSFDHPTSLYRIG